MINKTIQNNKQNILRAGSHNYRLNMRKQSGRAVSRGIAMTVNSRAWSIQQAISAEVAPIVAKRQKAWDSLGNALANNEDQNYVADLSKYDRVFHTREGDSHNMAYENSPTFAMVETAAKLTEK